MKPPAARSSASLQYCDTKNTLGRVRHSRYVGQAETHLAHLMATAIINIVRLLRWLAGEPQAQTQLSSFVRLYQGAA